MESAHENVHQCNITLPAFNAYPQRLLYTTQGLTDEWIFQRSGIRRRTRAADDENTHTMAIEAINSASHQIAVRHIRRGPYRRCDLHTLRYGGYARACGAGPFQYTFGSSRYHNIRLLVICKCGRNSRGLFCNGQIKTGPVIASEHNYSTPTKTAINRPISGEMEPDARSYRRNDAPPMTSKILDVHTAGLGHIGKGVAGIYLRPSNGGLHHALWT